MKLTNAEIFNAKGAFTKLLNVKLPIKVNYELMQTVTKLNDQWTIIEGLRSKLVQEYGKEDEKRKGIFQVTPDCPKYANFMADFGELMMQEVELDIKVVKIPDTLEIEATVLMPLQKFVTI